MYPAQQSRREVEVLRHVGDHAPGLGAHGQLKVYARVGHAVPHLHLLVLLDPVPLHVRPGADLVEVVRRGGR